jgi:hypothetical protein
LANIIGMAKTNKDFKIDPSVKLFFFIVITL